MILTNTLGTRLTTYHWCSLKLNLLHNLQAGHVWDKMRKDGDMTLAWDSACEACAAKAGILKFLSLAYQEKDWQPGPSQSFFWYDILAFTRF